MEISVVINQEELNASQIAARWTNRHTTCKDKANKKTLISDADTFIVADNRRKKPEVKGKIAEEKVLGAGPL